MSKRFVCAVLLLAMLLSLVIPSLVFEAHAAEEGETASGSVHHADENAPDLEDPERIREVEKTNAEIEQYMLNKSMMCSGGGNAVSITARKQTGDSYCGPACVQMVVEALTGTLYSQDTLANSMGTDSSGTYVYAVTNELNYRIGSGSYEYVGTWESTFGNSLVYSIDKGKPMVCHLMTGTLDPYVKYCNETGICKDNGHFVAAYGYYGGATGATGSGTCYYADPSNVEDGKFFGKFSTSIESMITSINRNAGYYIRGK